MPRITQLINNRAIFEENDKKRFFFLKQQKIKKYVLLFMFQDLELLTIITTVAAIINK